MRDSFYSIEEYLRRVSSEEYEIFLTSENWTVSHTFTVVDLIPKGWTIVGEGDVQSSKFEVKDLELVSFLKNREKYVHGETVRKRADALEANLGLIELLYTLNHQAEIPVGFKGKYLEFTRQLLRSPSHRFYMVHLCWEEHGKRWYFGGRGIGRGWDDRHRLVRYKPALNS